MLGSFADLRQSLEQESLRFSSGMRSTNYAGLGSDVSTSLKLHDRLSSISTFSDLISSAQTEINFSAQSLTSITALIDSINSGPLSLAGGSDKIGRTTAKSSIQTQFSSLVSYLRTQGPSGYVFGGEIDANPPVAESDILLNGSGNKAGLLQLFDERFAADSGPDDLGRLSVTTSGNQVSISEEASGLPFGLKLSSVDSDLTHVNVTQASGSPQTESLTFSGQPTVGDIVTLKFGLPDGSTSSITLRAATATGAGQFAIGATTSDTALNFQNSLKSTIASLVSSDLASASAIYTAKNFFSADANNPPERISGTPLSSATHVVSGTSANTVIWYTGKSDTNDPRTDRSIRIGDEISVYLGVRANEKGFQSALSGVAATWIMTQRFSSDETTAANQMTSIRQRASQLSNAGKTDVQEIVASIAASQNVTKQISDQNNSVRSLLQRRLAEVEGVNSEETAAMISSLTTQLQASYQVTSKLLNLSLSSYI